MPDGHVAPGVFALLGAGRDGVEADVGEEDDGRAGADPREAVGRERVPVRGPHEPRAGEDEEGQDDELDADHDGVEPRRLLHAPDEDDRDGRDDAHREGVEDDRARRGRAARSRGSPGTSDAVR